ncbi:MAG: archaeosortase A [Halobacteriales archaeon]|nr:archaeosortase A [Halobacteriales archaeon]
MIPVVPTGVTDAVAWVVIALLVAAWGLREREPDLSRAVAAAAWVGFAVFWLLLVPRFAFVMKSPIETVLSALAVPGSLYAGYLLWQGRERLFTLSRAVALMGLLYLPFTTIAWLEQRAIEGVAAQIHWVITTLGYEVTLMAGPDHGYQSALLFNSGGEQFVTHIVLACTGLGSIAIFAGLIGALDAPLGRRLKGIGIAAGIIYLLNVVRNVFIAVAFGEQWFQILVEPVMAVTGYTQPGLVSFFIADRVLSQSLSIVALVAITWLVVRTVPELLGLVEEALFVVTRTEYDLYAALAVDADGR